MVKLGRQTEEGKIMQEVKRVLQNGEHFNFVCKMCGNCCNEMLIKLTPYDIIRLSAGLNLPTHEFIPQYVLFLKLQDTGWFLPVLKHVKKGECLFKRGKKCRIHPYRPLPCRLFPVGRSEENFVLQMSLYCKGLLTGCRWNLNSWLEASEAITYLEMSKLYYDFMEEILQSYELKTISDKQYKLFFKIVYDFDGARLDLNCSGINDKTKVKYCLAMGKWFLERFSEPHLLEELSEEQFLDAYEKQGRMVLKQLIEQQ